MWRWRSGMREWPKRKRILRFDKIKTNGIRIVFDSARACPCINNVSAYYLSLNSQLLSVSVMPLVWHCGHFLFLWWLWKRKTQPIASHQVLYGSWKVWCVGKTWCRASSWLLPKQQWLQTYRWWCDAIGDNRKTNMQRDRIIKCQIRCCKNGYTYIETYTNSYVQDLNRSAKIVDANR